MGGGALRPLLWPPWGQRRIHMKRLVAAPWGTPRGKACGCPRTAPPRPRACRLRLASHLALRDLGPPHSQRVTGVLPGQDRRASVGWHIDPRWLRPRGGAPFPGRPSRTPCTASPSSQRVAGISAPWPSEMGLESCLQTPPSGTRSSSSTSLRTRPRTPESWAPRPPPAHPWLHPNTRMLQAPFILLVLRPETLRAPAPAAAGNTAGGWNCVSPGRKLWGATVPLTGVSLPQNAQAPAGGERAGNGDRAAEA